MICLKLCGQQSLYCWLSFSFFQEQVSFCWVSHFPFESQKYLLRCHLPGWGLHSVLQSSPFFNNMSITRSIRTIPSFDFCQTLLPPDSMKNTVHLLSRTILKLNCYSCALLEFSVHSYGIFFHLVALFTGAFYFSLAGEK